VTNILATGWPRPHTAGVVEVGSVRLLEWTFPARRVDPRAVKHQDIGTARDPVARPHPDLFAEFLALPAQDERDVVAFALRWGVLGACWHGGRHDAHDITPFLLALSDLWPAGKRLPVPPRARERPTHRGRRQLDHWIRYSNTFAAVLRINYELRHGRPGSSSDWATAWGADVAGLWASARPLDEQRWVVDQLVAWWQTEAHAASRLSSVAGRVDVEPESLDAALVVFAIEALRAGRTVLTCSVCARAYLRDRPPRDGERNYCDQHERRDAWRLTQAERRANLTPTQREAERRASAARMKALREKRRRDQGDA